MTRVTVSLTVPSMRFLSHRRTDMGTRIPLTSIGALRTMLNNPDAFQRAEFRIKGHALDVNANILNGSSWSLNRLANLGVTEVYLLHPEKDDYWALITLSRDEVPFPDYTPEELREFDSRIREGDRDWVARRTHVKVGVVR